MVDVPSVLARHPFFAPLSPGVLASVVGRVVIRVYEKNALLYLEGERAPGLFVVASGNVRVFKTSPEGRDQDLYHASAGESLNGASAFEEARTIANAQATEPAVILLIRREVLGELIREHPQVAAAVLRVFSGRLRELATLVGDLSLRDVTGRLGGLLLRLAGDTTVAALPRRSDLAARVGTVREVVTRALRALESSGAIRLEGGAVVILDRVQLEQGHDRRWPLVFLIAELLRARARARRRAGDASARASLSVDASPPPAEV
jgi:CRP/FNR family transcriptional regulator